MHKLVILIEQSAYGEAFQSEWPMFLRYVEDMPGLRRETSSQVDHFLFGKPPYAMMHELIFDSLPELQQALASPVGVEAGHLLQRMTGGRIALFLADHKEDDLSNILRFRQEKAG